MNLRKYVAIFALCICISTYFATNSECKENYMMRAEKFSSDSLYKYIDNTLPAVDWIGNNSKMFVYSPTIGGKNKYYLVDTKTFKKRELFIEDELIKLSDSFLKLKPLKQELRKYRITVNFDSSCKKMNSFTYNYRGHKLRYDIRKKKVTEVKQPSLRNTSYKIKGDLKKKFSYDSLYRISAINDNLYLFYKDGRDSLKLTEDGELFHSYAIGRDRDIKKSGLQYPEGDWMGKSHKYIITRTDKRKVGSLTLVDNLSMPRPVPNTYKFPMPGDKDVPIWETYIVDADKGKIEKITELEAYPDQEYLMERFDKYRMVGGNAYFLRTNRQHSILELCKVSPEGKVKVIISDKTEPHLNEQMFGFKILSAGKEIIWWSERSGKGKHYLYDGEGNLKNQIEDKDFVAGKITYIDVENRKLYIEGYGGEEGINPNYRFYYAVPFDGGKPVLLTPGNGYHSIEFSPDHKFIVDTYSRMDAVPKHQICDINGNILFKMQGCDATHLFNKGWKYPEVIALNAADSTTKLYGVVYLPFQIEKGKKYPIIANVYPGPQDDQVPLKFTLDDNYNQSLAQLGFIVVNFQFRGSCPWRGRDFYTYGYGNLRDYPLDDLHAIIEQISKRYSYADIERVGIYGHSGGGFMTVSAMLDRPDFYKVGIAASGNYDNNIYTQWWGESFHGGKWLGNTNENIKFDCKIPTPIEMAGRLKGRLLLVTGDVDNNVHPANTMRMAKALIDSNKRFDMLILPGVDHGVGDRYYINVIRYYFTEHLLGIKLPDRDIVKHL